MNTPKDKKAADLVRRLHNEAKVRGRAAPLLEEAATKVRMQAMIIERLERLVRQYVDPFDVPDGADHELVIAIGTDQQ